MCRHFCKGEIARVLARRALRGSEGGNWMFTRGLPARQKHGLAAPGYLQAALTGL